MRAIVLRAGDFYGGGRGSWLDLVITKDFARGRLTYPGPLDVMHAWAYLPDLAQTMVLLAERRAAFGPFETFGFAGHAMTGTQLIAEIETAAGRKFNVRPMGWWFIKSFGRLLALGRELAELEYLWRVPHRISGEKLQRALGEVPNTAIPKAIAASLKELGLR
jgi:nucleoside-diphosphate-sugar epimerase